MAGFASRIASTSAKSRNLPDASELVVISQFGKIIRVDTKQIRAAGRATQGVRLLNLEEGDKVAAAVIIPPDELNGNGKDEEQGSLLQ